MPHATWTATAGATHVSTTSTYGGSISKRPSCRVGRVVDANDGSTQEEAWAVWEFDNQPINAGPALLARLYTDAGLGFLFQHACADTSGYGLIKTTHEFRFLAEPFDASASLSTLRGLSYAPTYQRRRYAIVWVNDSDTVDTQIMGYHRLGDDLDIYGCLWFIKDLELRSVTAAYSSAEVWSMICSPYDFETHVTIRLG